MMDKYRKFNIFVQLQGVKNHTYGRGNLNGSKQSCFFQKHNISI
jgi:hypothetical protein